MTLAWLSRYTVLTKWSFSVPSTSCSWWHSTRKAFFSIPQFQLHGKIISALSAFFCEVQSLLLETGRVGEAKQCAACIFYANMHVFMQMYMRRVLCRCSWSAMSNERHRNLVFSEYYPNGWTMTKCLKPVQELQQVCPSLSMMSVHMHATACIWRSQYDFHKTVISFQLPVRQALSCFCFPVYSEWGSPWIFQQTLVSASNFAVGVMGLQMHDTASGLFCGFWGLYLGHQAWVAGVFTSWASPWPSSTFLTRSNLHYKQNWLIDWLIKFEAGSQIAR